MSEIWISDQGEADLFDIYRYGIETFGIRQANLYRDRIDDSFRKLADFPHMGRSADSIRKGLRRHEHGSHVIFYREKGEGIVIVAVVHARSLRGLDL